VSAPEGKLARAFIPSSAWLTRRRIRAHAILLAISLWGVCAVDYSTPGIFDRAGNIKFQDFLQFPIAARLVVTGHSDQLYDDRVLASGIRAIAGRDTNVYLQYFYGPQVALLFIPLASLPFLLQAVIFAALSLALYFGCVYLLSRQCPALRRHTALIAICALAYPPLFHFFVRGQVSALVLVCFTAAYLAFRAKRDFLAGVALGFLAFKPQFLVAIPLILLLAQAWNALAGVVALAAAQLALTSICFESAVMSGYFARLLHSARHPGSTELIFSPIQMHSARSLWELLIPWSHAVWALYLLTCFAVIGIATAIWKSSCPLALRFSALLFAAILANPHIYIYDLLSLAPAFLLLVDWSLNNPQHPSKPAVDVLLYLAFLLPLLGPLARWTHLQLSVVVFVAILWFLYRIATTSYKLALRESHVV